MKASELINKLTEKMAELGDVPVKILTVFEDEDGEDRNCENDIWYVEDMFGRYIYLTPDE